MKLLYYTDKFGNKNLWVFFSIESIIFTEFAKHAKILNATTLWISTQLKRKLDANGLKIHFSPVEVAINAGVSRWRPFAQKQVLAATIVTRRPHFGWATSRRQRGIKGTEASFRAWKYNVKTLQIKLIVWSEFCWATNRGVGAVVVSVGILGKLYMLIQRAT